MITIKIVALQYPNNSNILNDERMLLNINIYSIIEKISKRCMASRQIKKLAIINYRNLLESIADHEHSATSISLIGT